jgi:hypothetical protein
MSPSSWYIENGGSAPRTAGDALKDLRAEAERARQEKAEQRRLEAAELQSNEHSPERRIRAWEKLYGLHLPTDANHPVLDVIAASTHLTLEQLREEQRARAARRSIGFAGIAATDADHGKA